ncbi:MAG: type II toxin-antitoxin system PemK/MazF family toxin [Nitrospirota bacterium]
MAVVISRFDVCLVNLDPTRGHEIKKTRPCLIISPDEMNRHVRTVIIAPMTTVGREYPTRISTSFEGKKGQIVLDQVRTVDKKRLVKVLGKIDDPTAGRVLETLADMFAP